MASQVRLGRSMDEPSFEKVKVALVRRSMWPARTAWGGDPGQRGDEEGHAWIRPTWTGELHHYAGSGGSSPGQRQEEERGSLSGLASPVGSGRMWRCLVFLVGGRGRGCRWRRPRISGGQRRQMEVCRSRGDGGASWYGWSAAEVLRCRRRWRREGAEGAAAGGPPKPGRQRREVARGGSGCGIR